jgi:hypothetical protein
MFMLLWSAQWVAVFLCCVVVAYWHVNGIRACLRVALTWGFPILLLFAAPLLASLDRPSNLARQNATAVTLAPQAQPASPMERALQALAPVEPSPLSP